MGGNFNFSEVKKLQKQLERLSSESDALFRECVKELAARLLAKVTRLTPVGRPPKITGSKTTKIKGVDGKSRTFLSAEGARHAKYWAGYQGGTLRRSWTIGEIRKEGKNYRVEVINPMSYASYVENGHRQQPGRYVPALGVRLKAAWVPGKFMLKISEQEIAAISTQLIERRLDARLREVFNA